MNKSLKYRSDIDGLRAIAVLSVIAYHAKINFATYDLFKGGFIGVDIFFVISGYLITSIIINELKKNIFSFKNFYERRARRILPRAEGAGAGHSEWTVSAPSGPSRRSVDGLE